jgi:hypothetical protein
MGESGLHTGQPSHRSLPLLGSRSHGKDEDTPRCGAQAGGESSTRSTVAPPGSVVMSGHPKSCSCVPINQRRRSRQAPLHLIQTSR